MLLCLEHEKCLMGSYCHNAFFLLEHTTAKGFLPLLVFPLSFFGVKPSLCSFFQTTSSLLCLSTSWGALEKEESMAKQSLGL